MCIIEDQADIREVVAERLSAMPMVRLVGAFASAEAALPRLSSLAPRLTFLDIGLPGMSGTAALAQLVADDFPGDVVMFTVFDTDDELFAALELGAVGYVLKSEGAAGVERALEEYRRGGAPMTRRIARRVLERFRVPARPAHDFAALSPQENTVLELVAEGLLNKEIAARLAIAEATVKRHNVNIYRKLSVNNRAEAVRAYLTRA